MGAWPTVASNIRSGNWDTQNRRLKWKTNSLKFSWRHWYNTTMEGSLKTSKASVWTFKSGEIQIANFRMDLKLTCSTKGSAIKLVWFSQCSTTIYSNLVKKWLHQTENRDCYRRQDLDWRQFSDLTNRAFNTEKGSDTPTTTLGLQLKLCPTVQQNTRCQLVWPPRENAWIQDVELDLTTHRWR